MATICREFVGRLANQYVQVLRDDLWLPLKLRLQGGSTVRRDMSIRVEIWLAAASLHDKGHRVITTEELQDEVKRLFDDVRPGVLHFINAHANASAPKNLAVVYNYLFRVERGRHRLCRVTDAVHPSRVGSPLWPEQADVHQRFWPLWRKWVAWQQKGDPAPTEVAATREAVAPAVTTVRQPEDGSGSERLAAYVRSLPDFTMERSPATGYDHMGAIISEAILQAGINYRNVVVPRIEALRREHPQARTTSAFADLLLKVGAPELLAFGGEKPERVEVLTRFFLDEQVETEADLREWLTSEANLSRLRQLPGVGPKTADYLQILAGLDTSAVDRHLALFLEEAGVAANTYQERKAVIDAAAALLGVDRAVLDYSIWRYMSDRAARGETRRPAEVDEVEAGEEDPDAAHYLLSSYREAMLEHLLIGELMRKSWPKPLEVYNPQVDAVGVDLLLVRDGVTRAVQLKTSKIGGRANSVNVHTSLWDRPGRCVIWTLFDPDTLELKEYLWLGEPGQPLPPIDELEVARHTKANAQGYKAYRPALRVVPKRWFKRLTSVDELLDELFGPRTR